MDGAALRRGVDQALDALGVGRRQDAVGVTAKNDVRKTARGQTVSQGRVVPPEGRIVLGQRNHDRVDMAERALDSPSQDISRKPRTDRSAALCVGERRHRVRIASHVVVRSGAAPGAEFVDDDGPARLDGCVETDAVYRCTGEEHARTAQR